MHELIEKLETQFFANHDPQFYFALLTCISAPSRLLDGRCRDTCPLSQTDFRNAPTRMDDGGGGREPSGPRGWREFEIIYKHGQRCATRYQIKVENPHRICRSVAKLEVDGKIVMVLSRLVDTLIKPCDNSFRTRPILDGNPPQVSLTLTGVGAGNCLARVLATGPY